MKKFNICLVVIAALSFLAFSLSLADQAKKEPSNGKTESQGKSEKTPPEINWVTYDKGVQQAKKDGKKLMLEFTAKWCGYCKKMRATTFKDPDVIAMLNENYITATVDGESRDTINLEGWMTNGRSLAKEYRIQGYPTYWFFTSEGEKIAPVRGYRSKEELYDILDYLKDDVYKSKKFEEFLRDKKKGN